MGAYIEQIRAQLLESCRVKQSFSEELLARVETFAVRAAEALAAGHKLVFFGNGGSAADAQHLAAETRRPPARGPAGTSRLGADVNTSVLTAAGTTMASNKFFRGRLNRWWNAETFWWPFPPAERVQTSCAAWSGAAAAPSALP